jgi:hypothetical protein
VLPHIGGFLLDPPPLQSLPHLRHTRYSSPCAMRVVQAWRPSRHRNVFRVMKHLRHHDPDTDLQLAHPRRR